MREAVKKVVAAFPEHPEDQTQSFQVSFNKGTVFFFFFFTCSEGNRTGTFRCSMSFTKIVIFWNGLNSSLGVEIHFQ